MTRKYTAEHIWIDAQDPDNALIGITEHAQQTLGDVVYVSLPTPGTALTQGQVAGEIESVKAAADLYTPASASVLEVNQEVLDDPSLVNTSPQDRGWLLRVRLLVPEQLADLLDAPAA